MTIADHSNGHPSQFVDEDEDGPILYRDDDNEEDVPVVQSLLKFFFSVKLGKRRFVFFIQAV